MSTFPQCERFVTSLTKESAYGTAIADGSLTEMFNLIEPVLPDENRDIIDDSAFLKGHEFRLDPNAYQVLFIDRTLSFNNVPANAELLAWLFASALGSVSSAQIDTSGDYTHTIKLQDMCATGRQLPSRTIGLLWAGSSSVNTKFKGCVLNTLTLRVADKGYVYVDFSFITDGSEGDGSAIAVPASFHSTNFYFGKDTDWKEDDFDTPGGLTSRALVFRGYEFTINNNLDVDEAKRTSFQQLDTLPKLYFGNREITAQVTILGDETHDLYVDSQDPNVMKITQMELLGNELAGGNDADCIISFPKTYWRTLGKPFDGMERTFQLGHDAFYDATASSPLVVTVVTRDTAVV